MDVCWLCPYMFRYVCMCVCICVCVFMYVCMYICVYVCIDAVMCVLYGLLVCSVCVLNGVVCVC